MKSTKVFAVIALLMIVFMAGCKKAEDPKIPPTVTSTVPLNNALSTVISSNLTATFSEPMNPLTITTLSFTLKNGTVSVAGVATYTDSTATLNPTETLLPNTIYTATISRGVQDLAGTIMVKDYIWNFTTGAIPDVTAPTVTLTDPLNNATGVAVNKLVAVTFSEAMDPASITALTYTLKQGTVAVPGAVSYTGLKATFTPTANLDFSKVYTGSVTVGAKDVAGNALATVYTFSFTTGALPDVIAPTVTLTDPLNSATGVAINKLVAVTFSEAMDPASITALTYTLKQGSVAVPGTVSYTGLKATFTPTANLDYSKVYTGSVSVGAKDVAGNALAAVYTFSFTTSALADIIAPTVTLTDPLNNATDVAVNQLFAVTFSEAMDPASITALTYTLKQGTVSVPGAVSYVGLKATFTPTASLDYNKVYTGTVTVGAKDVAGNALATVFTFSFTTVAVPDIIAPTVLSTSPLNNAINVSFSSVVVLTFSELMDPLTINANTFTLKQGTTAVPGTVSYTATTATFTPSNALLTNTVYSATMTTGGKDLAGNALASNTAWSFTTKSVLTGQAVVNLGTSANYVILAKTAINNSPTSAITGDIGLSPAATSYVTGFGLTNATGYATSPQITGKIFAADMVTPTSINLTTAVENMITAYNDAAGRPNPDFLELATGNIGGMTLSPGLYKWTNTVTLPSSVTINGGVNDVWIFQIAGNLSVANGVNVTLTGGAQAKNIFWQVAGEAIIGTTAHFEGIILSWTGITFQTGASFKGRALAGTAVILDSNAVVQP